jgi:hypothetical protein
MIPVFDTLRVFGTRIWKGRSPFSADKTHIHHLITNKGFTHGFAARIICVFHGFILIPCIWDESLKPELAVDRSFLLYAELDLLCLIRIGRIKQILLIRQQASGHQQTQGRINNQLFIC